MKSYPSDVRTLSDEELPILIKEIEEAYCHASDDGDWWADEEAEQRWREMYAEMDRRSWERMTPEEREKYEAEVKAFAKRALRVLLSQSTCDSLFPKGGRKIGDTVKVRKPQRYVA